MELEIFLEQGFWSEDFTFIAFKICDLLDFSRYIEKIPKNLKNLLKSFTKLLMLQIFA